MYFVDFQLYTFIPFQQIWSFSTDVSSWQQNLWSPLLSLARIISSSGQSHMEVLNISTFHGVQLQSGLWDMAKYFECYELLTPMPVFNDTVIEQWPKLFELHQYKFLRTFQRYFTSLQSKVAPFLLYRTINFVNIQPDNMKRWNNKRGKIIISKIRHISRKNAQLLNLQLFDWYHFKGSNILMDGFHPQKQSSILIAQHIIDQTKKWHYISNMWAVPDVN